MRGLAPALALLLLAVVPAAGEEWTVVVDPAASEVAFTLGATLHSVHGTARLERGEVRFDPATGTASGEVVADARSAETGNGDRDKDMHRKVLESERFPTIVFRPREVAGALDPAAGGRVTVRGDFEIHGASHPVELAAEVEIADGRLEARGDFSVPYVEWGMKDPSKFVLRVAKQVEVSVRLVGSVVPPAAVEPLEPPASGG